MPQPHRQLFAGLHLGIPQCAFDSHELAGRCRPKTVHPAALDSQHVARLSNMAFQAILPTVTLLFLQIDKAS